MVSIFAPAVVTIVVLGYVLKKKGILKTAQLVLKLEIIVASLFLISSLLALLVSPLFLFTFSPLVIVVSKIIVPISFLGIILAFILKIRNVHSNNTFFIGLSLLSLLLVIAGTGQYTHELRDFFGSKNRMEHGTILFDQLTETLKKPQKVIAVEPVNGSLVLENGVTVAEQKFDACVYESNQNMREGLIEYENTYIVNNYITAVIPSGTIYDEQPSFSQREWFIKNGNLEKPFLVGQIYINNNSLNQVLIDHFCKN